MIAEFSEAADTHGEDLSGHIVIGFEGDLTRRTVFITGDFLHIEIVHALVFPRVSVIGEAFAHLLQHLFHTGLEITGENGWLARCVIDEFARLI